MHLSQSVSNLSIRIHKKIKRLAKRIMEPLRKQYRQAKAKKLTNQNFTILSNNCTAGIMYNSLNHRFDSPTINMWMPNKHFFEFLNHLDYYITAKPEKIDLEGINYPVGRIRRGEEEIHLYFMHYTSFDVACEKWLERGKRVNKDNLYVVYNAVEADRLEQFQALEYRHKVMLTHYDRAFPAPDGVVDMPVYQRSVERGVLLRYKTMFSLKRWLDDFDYISFLNETS